MAHQHSHQHIHYDASDQSGLRRCDTPLHSREETEGQGFGGKTIGLLGGIALCFNNIVGPGVIAFPKLYQQTGWVTVIFSLVVFGAISIMCGLMLVQSMTMIPGNRRLQRRVEFAALAEHWLSYRGYVFVCVCFQIAMYTALLAAIVQTAHMLDFFISNIFNESCGLEFYPNPFSWTCGSRTPLEGDNAVSPFPDQTYLLSGGFMLGMVVMAPFGFVNLEDNIWVQKILALLTVGFITLWTVVACTGAAGAGFDMERVPAFGVSQSHLLGVTLFNFGLVGTLPSWANEKKPAVSVRSTLVNSVLISVPMYIVLGLFGGMAYLPFYNSSETFLDKVLASGPVARYSAYLFPIVLNVSSVPVQMIMVRYNLIQTGLCGRKWATFFGTGLPWLIALPLYSGKGFTDVVNWGGLLGFGLVNFILPAWIYRAAVLKTGIGHMPHELNPQIQVLDSETTPLQRDLLSPRSEKVAKYAFKGVSKVVPKFLMPYRAGIALGTFVFMSLATLGGIYLTIYHYIESSS